MLPSKADKNRARYSGGPVVKRGIKGDRTGLGSCHSQVLTSEESNNVADGDVTGQDGSEYAQLTFSALLRTRDDFGPLIKFIWMFIPW